MEIFWLKRKDLNRLEKICEDARLSPYCFGEIYSGILKNSDELSEIGKAFVLGELDKNNEVLLLNNSHYGKNGIRLTQGKKRGGIPLVVGDGDVISSAFLTYYSDAVIKTSNGKRNERNNHFVLYSALEI